MQQHPHMDMVICPYNATHHVPREKEESHIVDCPDRRIVELQRYRYNQPLPGQHGNLSNPPVYGSASIPYQGEEDDDDELDINAIISERDLRTAHRSQSRSPSRFSAVSGGSGRRNRRRSSPFGAPGSGRIRRFEPDSVEAILAEQLARQQLERGDGPRGRGHHKGIPAATGKDTCWRRVSFPSASNAINNSTRLVLRFAARPICRAATLRRLRPRPPTTRSAARCPSPSTPAPG